ncbi:MAG: hypothetical protein WC792_06025 [Candidatus Micrarchaeia archaeon]|jgi:hypothetical protein
MANSEEYTQAPAQEYPYIRSTTALADGKETFLGMKTRWEFVCDWLPFWKEAIRYRMYSYALFFIGILTLFTAPIIAIPAFFGATYYYVVVMHKKDLLTNDRKVIWGH